MTGSKPHSRSNKIIWMEVVLAMVEGLLCLLLVFGVPFAWLMRDGLGPDSTSSQGSVALMRALGTFYLGPVLMALAGLVLFMRRAVRKARERRRSSG